MVFFLSFSRAGKRKKKTKRKRQTSQKERNEVLLVVHFHGGIPLVQISKSTVPTALLPSHFQVKMAARGGRRWVPGAVGGRGMVRGGQSRHAASINPGPSRLDRAASMRTGLGPLAQCFSWVRAGTVVCMALGAAGPVMAYAAGRTHPGLQENRHYGPGIRVPRAPPAPGFILLFFASVRRGGGPVCGAGVLETTEVAVFAIIDVVSYRHSACGMCACRFVFVFRPFSCCWKLCCNEQGWRLWVAPSHVLVDLIMPIIHAPHLLQVSSCDAGRGKHAVAVQLGRH